MMVGVIAIWCEMRGLAAWQADWIWASLKDQPPASHPSEFMRRLEAAAAIIAP